MKWEKRKKYFNIIGLCILVFYVIPMVYAGVTEEDENMDLFHKEIFELNQGWTLTKQGQVETIELPYSYDVGRRHREREAGTYDVPEGREGENLLLENTIPEEFFGLTLLFSSSSSHFKLYMDGNLVSEGDEEEETRMIDQGARMYFVSIPETLKEGKVRIEFSALYPVRVAYMRVASHDTAVLGMLVRNLFNIVCSLVMFICGMVLLFMIVMRKSSKGSIRGMNYLSLFCLAAGVYYALDTRVISAFVGKQTVMYLLMYTCLMLSSYLFTMYYAENLEKKYRRCFLIFLRLSVVNIIVQFLLQIFEIRDFHLMQNVTHLLLISCGVAAFICFYFDAKKERTKKSVYKMAAMVPLVLGEVIDVFFMLNLNVSNTVRFGRYGVTLFCMGMMFYCVMRVSNGYSESVAKNERLLKREIEYEQRRNEELVAAKTEAEGAKAEAVQANEAKERFLANMSHEIRTPINAVLGMNEMILRESREANIKEYAMDIQIAGRNLLSLINDILDFSKINSGKLEIVPVEYDFSSMVHDVVNMIYLKAQAKDLKLNIEVDSGLPSTLYGDDVRIRQVLLNILSNAVKYTHQGSVYLRIGGRTQGDVVSLDFEVEDTGIGIKAEDISKLFVEFERIEEKRNRSIEGTGLGMNITTQILDLMGSRLQVESEYGKGSRFYFTLEQKVINGEPIGDLEQRIRRVSEEFTYDVTFTAPEAKVLVVDDNSTNCKVFQNLLKETKIHIDVAQSGKECLRMVGQNAYDLIFLDYMMPEMNGIETLHQMKAMEDYPSKAAKVVALTADAVVGAKEMYLNAGFDDYLSKPVLPDKLERMLRRHLPEELVVMEAKGGAASTDETDLVLPDVEGLDWAYGRMHLPETELLVDTVKDFYGSLESQADTLQKYFEAKDVENYRIFVHSMKSSGALIGIIPLAGMAKVLEGAAREGNWDVVERMHGIFLSEWLGYKEKLSSLCQEKEQEKVKVEDGQIMLAYLEMLRVAMEDLDIDRADEMMDNLKKYEYPDGAGEDLKSLETAVANLDSDAAGETITKLMDLFRRG